MMAGSFAQITPARALSSRAALATAVMAFPLMVRSIRLALENVDRGLEEAARLVHLLFDPLVEEASGLGAGLDWKTSLQELTATLGVGVPDYHVSEVGPDHEKTFTAVVRVAGEDRGSGTGRNKKEAEQGAAAAAWAAVRRTAPETVADGLDDVPRPKDPGVG